MGRAVPGTQNPLIAAPYQRTFASGAAPGDLTSFVHSAAASGSPKVAQYQNACSGMIMIVTAASPVIAWKDCNGFVNTFTLGATVVVGSYIPLPFAATSLDTVTNCSVVVYWHRGTQPAP